MKIKLKSKIREKIINTLLRIINKIDNSGNSIMSENGEDCFIDYLVDFYNKKDPIIFDVGANIGDYTGIFLDKFNKNENFKIHLFEPQKYCFEQLKNRFIDNNKIFGLSNENNDAIIYSNQSGSGFGSLYKRNLNFYELKMNNQEKVNLKTAQQYIESNKIKKINLLKIDIEGHELKALTGFKEYLNSDFIDFIQFEYGGANIDSHTNLLDFYNLLIPKKFKIMKIMGNYLELKDYDPRLDNFVYSNYVAISNNILNNYGKF